MDKTCPTHPNYVLWYNYARFAEDRGRLVAEILQELLPSLKNILVLDIGCGVGGTALALAKQGAKVVAVDINFECLHQLKRKITHSGLPVFLLVMSAQDLGLKTERFDGVILQDVLEHLPAPEKTLAEVARVTTKKGMLYLSTPNRLSPFNLLSDPHWNLPVVALLSRKGVAWVTQKVFRREKGNRPDLAALISFFKLRLLLRKNGFDFRLINRRVVQGMLNQATSVMNNPTHLRMVGWLKKWHLEGILVKIVNDNWGIYNFFINPTWYLIGQRR